MRKIPFVIIYLNHETNCHIPSSLATQTVQYLKPRFTSPNLTRQVPWSENPMSDDDGTLRGRKDYKRPPADPGIATEQKERAQVVEMEVQYLPTETPGSNDEDGSGGHDTQPSRASSTSQSTAGYPVAHSGMTPLPQQHPRLSNADLPGCIVRQDFSCVVLSDVLGQKGVEQCLSFHPNGLAIVQLAPTHPAVGTGENEIVEINFDAGDRNVLESAVVKGKKKKGALQLHPTTVLCSVTTQGGKKYKVCTGISGELFEANKGLKDDPSIMSSEPLGRGWVVIIRLKPPNLRRLQDVVGFEEER